LLNNTATEAKYNATIVLDGTTGIKGGSSGLSCFAETVLRFEVTGVGVTNAIDVQVKLRNSSNWYIIATITGAVTGTLDVSTYDFIRYNVVTANGTGSLYASGYILNNPSSSLLTDSQLRASPVVTTSGLRSGGVFGALNIPTANISLEAKVGATALSGRKMLMISFENAGIFWGLSSAVTITSGIPAANNSIINFDIDPSSSFKIWLVGSTNNKNVHIVEIP
jgi:hypothetical protein